MTDFANEAKQLWAASVFVRRGQGRDMTMAVRVLRHLTQSPRGVISGKAAKVLAEHLRAAGDGS